MKLGDPVEILRHPTKGISYRRGVDYVRDCHGAPVFPGDYVQCLTVGYSLIAYGRRGRVAQIVDGRIKLHGIRSLYDPCRFRLYGRYHPYHKAGVDKRYPREKYQTHSEKEAGKMLHLAIRVPEGWSYQDLSNSINNLDNDISAGFPTAGHKVMTDVTLSALKERIKARIHHNPEERWLMLSGNTIAESSAPPVTFRQW